MRLATKLTSAIAVSALLLVGGGGALQLRVEERDLRAVAQSETLLLGRSLQVAFENALRDRQLEDVNETLGALSRVDPSIAIMVFDEQGRMVGASSGARVTEGMRRIGARARSGIEPVVEFEPSGTPKTLRVGLRLRDETPESPSAIVLEKPLAELQRDLENTQRQIGGTVLLFVLLVASVTWAISWRYVGMPLGQLIAGMRRVQQGDLGIPLAARSDDEVGETQLEFERLVRELDEAKARAAQEQDARRRVERGLEHADKLITLGQLSAIMAHEIGSPLQVLEGRARALLKHAEDATATRRTVEMLLEQTTRITGIVEQMLAITRRRPAQRARVDAEPLLRRVASLVEIEARRRAVAVEVLRTGETSVLVDPDQLQQVILNLLRNALDAAPNGSTIRLSIGRQGEWLELLVEDEGPGVSEATRPHIFEPFFTTKSDRGGSGLGLSVVKSIVQQHEGGVELLARQVNGRPAPGCCARVCLPCPPREVQDRKVTAK
ncbi:MAG: HAMP domain-containing histidine kinase [Deltaproteobacteria bacterium]|nr:HAMP domain-containing histidine kinase [Deltaproteobacteria bacterium]